jgi:type 1 glutamine amidotransferase
MKAIVTAIFLCCLVISCLSQQKKHLLIITGGHGFDEASFYNMFDSLGNFSYDSLVQPRGNELIASSAVHKYAAIIFYDMYDSITPAQKRAYQCLLQQGKPMVFLHHSLVSYQHNWDEFQRIIGGKYYEQPTPVNDDTLQSSYQHDVNISVKIEDRTHPVTRGIEDFEIYDEVYGNFGIQTGIKPLLSTTHPGSSRYIAWVNHYGNTEVLFIQLGHGPEAFANPNFRKLLRQGIEWSIQENQGKSSPLR